MPTQSIDRTGFEQDIQFMRVIRKNWMLDRYQWEALQLLLSRTIIVLDLLGRCGFCLHYEDGQATGLRHASGVVYKPFPEDRREQND